MKTLVLVLTAALGMSNASAASSCEKAPENLLAAHNCAFTKDVAGWIDEDQEGIAEHDPSEGASAPGALAISGPEESAVIFSPCIIVKPATGYRVSASMKTSTEHLSISCEITARQYTDTACRKDRDWLDLSALVAPEKDWQTASDERYTKDTSRSVRLHVECNGDSGFRVLVDDMVFSEYAE